MASEDSVEHFVHRSPAVLPSVVHRIRDLDDRRQSGWPPMQSGLKEMHRIFKELHVCSTCREAHVPPHERQEMLRDRASRGDREDEHVRVAWLRPDPAAFEDLLSHLEKLASFPVLVYEKLRLDVKPKRVGLMPLYGDAPASLTLHDAGYKPTSRLDARQSFLLIVRTRHIVTVPPAWDGTRSAGFSDVPAYS